MLQCWAAKNQCNAVMLHMALSTRAWWLSQLIDGNKSNSRFNSLKYSSINNSNNSFNFYFRDAHMSTKKCFFFQRNSCYWKHRFQHITSKHRTTYDKSQSVVSLRKFKPIFSGLLLPLLRSSSSNSHQTSYKTMIEWRCVWWTW